MKKAYIKKIAYYLPSEIVSNEQLIQIFPEWTLEKLGKKLGIFKRHISGVDETSVDMAISAAKILFSEGDIDSESIDFLILCTQSPDHYLPTSACIIQHKLGLSQNCAAIDINQGCSGFIYGLALSKSLVLSGVAKNVLLITSESYSKMIHPKDKSNRAIFGDGAAATIISEDGYAEILNFILGSDGSGAENLIVKTGAFRNRNRLNDLLFDESNNPSSSDYLYMNGSEILSFTLEKIPTLVQDILKKNDLQQDEIDLFIFHQANKYILDFLRKKLKISEDIFYYYLENVGNTVSSTIPIAIYEATKENKLKGNILLAGFGVGYSWGATILRVP